MRLEDINPSMQRLAFDFFYWFSRFEFALKEMGFLKSEKIGATAEADWNKFVAAHHSDYVLSRNAADLLAEKPKRQVVGRIELEFAEVPFAPGISDLGKVVAYAKTVRNNLFHGGKHDYDHWDDPERTARLLELTTKILMELAELGNFGGDYNRYY